MVLPRGSTATITFKYKFIDPADIVAAYLTVHQNGERVFEKDITTATVGTDRISWALTQEDTLSINPKPNCEIQIRYRLQNGTAGASPIHSVPPYNILKGGVI